MVGLLWLPSYKESACNAGDLGSIPGSGGSPGGEKGNLLCILVCKSPWTDPGVWSRYATTEGASHLAFGLGAKLQFGDHQLGFPPAAASPRREVRKNN